MILTFLDLLLPLRCAGCRAPGTAWCPRCDLSFGTPFPLHRAAFTHRHPPTYATAAHTGPPRRAVIAAKERNRRDLHPVLARALANAVPRIPDLPPAPTLVPVPSRPAAARRRGGPHMARIAALAARSLGLDTAHPLRLTPGARDSVGLTPAERADNLARHLTADAIPDAPVVLVDDVVTTGATAAACARVLGRCVVAVVACTAAV
ncbi:hypothetical protein BJP25_27585 [Actinokineospora bangkokensis]|uniref:Phosphoribosyltransferase n=2 Tax=Actinokineospora bangkokensis TaxID=1193682 RepID=A0A1Q9LGG0_9PSEU|nr:hypothetical protein BJP25_27585 [Actinokineospora bangkokensis]